MRALGVMVETMAVRNRSLVFVITGITAWFPVCGLNRLFDFSARECSQTCWEEINDMFSSN